MIVLVEGVCGAGKSTLIRALRTRAAAHGSPPLVVLGQRFTYAPIAPAEDAGILDAELNAQILDRLVRKVGEHAAAATPGTLILLDTLHVTQRVRPGVLDDAAFRACDDALHALGARLVFLEIPDDVLVERTIVGRRGTDFARYAEKFGSTEAEVAAHFQREQRAMAALTTRTSRLQSRTLTAIVPPDALADIVLAFVREE